MKGLQGHFHFIKCSYSNNYSPKCDLPTILRNAFILQFFVIYQVTILSLADQYDENREQGIWFVL